MPKFDENNLTEQDYEVLSQFMSNPHGNVSYMKNLTPPEVGAILARISRAPYSIRGTLLNEYLDEDLNFDHKRASQVVHRVLNQYGDDSVAELGGAHVFFSSVSNLVTKEIEDCRIGGSPIEESTRYVEFDKQDPDGRYRYIQIPNLPKELDQQYHETMTFLFETYAAMIKPMKTYFKELNPLDQFETAFDGKAYHELADEGQAKMARIAYQASIRAQACDVVRAVLPAATHSTLGIFGNGRFFTGLISRLETSEKAECQQLAHELRTELNKVMPEFIRRAAPDLYRKSIDKNMFTLATKMTEGIEPKIPGNVILLERPTNREEEWQHVLSDMLFPYTDVSLVQLRSAVSELSPEQRSEIISCYLGERKTRRSRPGRAMENGYPIQFELVGTFAEYRDMQRHRMLTQQRQRLSPTLGFVLPPEITEIGFQPQVEQCVARSKKLYQALVDASLTEEAQYVTLFNHYIRFSMGMNLREASHLIELRSQKAGHPGYRRMAQEMGRQITERDGVIAEQLLQFTDYEEHTGSLTRADAEAKTALKDFKLLR